MTVDDCSYHQPSFAGSSDIDLMIIGRAGLSGLTPALRAAEKRLLRELNVTNYSVEELRSQVRRGEHFLSNVLQKPKHFVKGSPIDLEAITR